MQIQVGDREAAVAAAETDCTSNPPPSSPSSPLSRFPEEELARNTARKRHYIDAKRKTTRLATAVSGDGVSPNAHHRRRAPSPQPTLTPCSTQASLRPGRHLLHVGYRRGSSRFPRRTFRLITRSRLPLQRFVVVDGVAHHYVVAAKQPPIITRVRDDIAILHVLPGSSGCASKKGFEW